MLIQILDVDYVFTNKPIIRIFGKQPNGNTVCIFYDRFFPYFYVKPKQDIKETISNLQKVKEIKEIEPVERFSPLGFHRKPDGLLRLTLLNPSEVPSVREKIAKYVEDIFEADIMFKYRFMVNYELYGMQWIDVDCEKERTKTVKVPAFHAKNITPVKKIGNAPFRYMSFDIECLAADPRKPTDAKKDPIIIISLAFNPDFNKNKTLVLMTKNLRGKGIKCFASEKEMLEEFLKIMDAYDPDIITGYNINGFDFPYLVERLRQHKLPLSLGRSDKPMFSRKYGAVEEFYISGRVIADPFQILKMDPWVKIIRYDLNTVAKKLLNEQKHDVEYGDMKNLWNGDKKDLSRLAEYGRNDSLLALKLLLDRHLLDKFFELSKISGVLLNDVFGGQTKRIETLLLHEFGKRDFVMPLSPSGAALNRRLNERNKKGLKGATVLEPEKGLHTEGCILVLDFKSLYPSLMRTYNISPDTVLLKKTEQQIKDTKAHKSPVGSYFVDTSIAEGIFPYQVKKLLESRQQVKKLMRNARGQEKRTLNATQLALKDIANSMYGYTGYVRARLYMIDVANSITAFGRNNLMKTKKLIEDNFDTTVLYADTDSAFLKTKLTDLDEAKKFGEKIARFVSEKLPGHLELEFEKVYRTFLILTKKRYAGWKFEVSDHEWKDAIEMRGIETVRRDWCPLVSEVMNDVLNIVLKEGDIQKAINRVKEVLIKLRKGEIPLEKLTIIKGITKNINSYDGILPHIELARKLAKRNPAEAPKIGDRIGFVIIRGNQMLSKRAEDPAYVRKNNLQIDSDYYINNQVFPPLERIFNAVGVEKGELFGSGRQASLGDIMNGTKAKRKHDICVECKTSTLDDWEEFACTKCKKTYRRMPLTGNCECGGEILICCNGSMGKKVVIK